MTTETSIFDTQINWLKLMFLLLASSSLSTLSFLLLLLFEMMYKNEPMTLIPFIWHWFRVQIETNTNLFLFNITFMEQSRYLAIFTKYYNFLILLCISSNLMKLYLISYKDCLCILHYKKNLDIHIHNSFPLWCNYE